MSEILFARLDEITTLVSDVGLLKANNLSDLPNVVTARDNLGVEIGVDVQAWDAGLDALAALDGTAGLLTETALNTYVRRSLAAPAAGFTITNPAGTAGNPTFVLANDLASLEAIAGTNVIPYRSASDTWGTVTISTGLTLTAGSLAISDAELLAIAGLTSAADTLPYFTGSGTAALTTLTAAGRDLLDDVSASAQRTTLGVAIGSNVQAWDADLDAVAALATTGLVRRTGAATWSAGTAVALSEMATQAAWTLVGNFTSGVAVPTAVNPSAFTHKASPSSTDLMTVIDVSASNAFKYATIAEIIGSTGSVTSLNTFTGPLNVRVLQQKFLSSGTYTPTSGMVYVLMEAIGGGGGGGSSSGHATLNVGGGGGGAGSYSSIVSTAATIGASQAVTIGAGGAGGASGSNNGSAGGDTSVGSLVIGKGGAGGNFASGAQIALGGVGGIAGTGTVTSVGAVGGGGSFVSNATGGFASGNGGVTRLGGNGLGLYLSGTGGSATANSGSGGAGGSDNATSTARAGGTGGSGIVIITEFVVN